MYHPISLPTEINNLKLLSYLGDRKYVVESLVCGCVFEKYYGNILTCVNGMCNTCRKEKDKLNKKSRNKTRGLLGLYRKTGNTWRAMKSRCYDENNQDYYMYGAVGITVCNRWLEPHGKGFRNFLEDMGERPEGTTLNRINGAKIYSKETCEWASLEVQSFDKKMYSNPQKPVGVLLVKTGWVVSFRKEYLTHTKDFHKACEVRAKAELEYFGKYLQDWGAIREYYEQNNCS